MGTSKHSKMIFLLAGWNNVEMHCGFLLYIIEHFKYVEWFSIDQSIL